MSDDNDLIGLKLAAWLGVWIVLMLAAFFLVGVVVGILVLVAGIVGFGWAAFQALRRADTTD